MRRALITLAFPPRVGGMEQLMYQRCVLDPEGVYVIAPGRGRSPEWDARQPFPIWRWRGGPHGLVGWRRVTQVWGAVQGLRAARGTSLRALELGQALPFGLVALWAHRHMRLPYTVWAFGDEILKPARRPLARAVLRRVLTEAEVVYAISEYTASLVRACGARRVRVVHPWPAPHFRPGDRESARRVLSLPNEAPLLLTVARLEPRKGVDRVLRALPAVLRAVPSVRYAVVGEGRARRRWQALASDLGVARAVIWPGQVPADVLPRWYQAADVFVLVPTPGPGEVEGFGLVYVEAGACGVPSVAGRNGGTPEAVLHGKTGLLVPGEDVDALAEAIITLLRDPELRARMGQAAQDHARRLRAAATHFLRTQEL